MSSRSYRNVVTSLALIEGSLLMLEDANSQNNKFDLSDKIKELRDIIATTYHLWPNKVTKKELLKIKGNLKKWENTVFPDRKSDFTALSSMGLLMLEEILTHVKDKKKTEHLNLIYSKLLEFHEKFDPNYDYNDLYEKAESAYLEWKKLQDTL